MITRLPACQLFSDRWNHNQKLRPFIPSSLNKKQTQLRLTARKRTEFGETKINNNCTVESAIDARGTIYHHHHNNCKKQQPMLVLRTSEVQQVYWDGVQSS